MKVNDILELTIEGQGMDGEGVARQNGVVIFIPYTLVGEAVKCKVTMVKKNFAQAKVIKVLLPSAYRAAPQCSAYFKCGGCDFLHIKSSAHAKLKQDELLSNFKKIGGEIVSLDEYVESNMLTEYRNKVQLPFGTIAGVATLGYYANKTHEIIPHERCLLHADWADKLSKIVLTFVKKRQISVYDERTGKGLMRHLVMRKIGGKVSIVLVVNGDKIPFADELIKAIEAGGYDFNLHININRQDTNVIMSDKIFTVYGSDTIKTEILGIKAEISPLSFMQINDYIRDKIYLKAMELMSASDIAVDLYSGIGITSNILAKTCDKVYSIEIVKDAVSNAKALAKANGNENKITAICGDVADELPKLLGKLRNNSDLKISDFSRDKDSHSCSYNAAKQNDKTNYAVLIDPPRKGCDQATIDAILQSAPDKIVYISCNSATLARDFAKLKQAYTLTHLSAYDMFPNTHHIETLCCLVKK